MERQYLASDSIEEAFIVSLNLTTVPSIIESEA